MWLPGMDGMVRLRGSRKEGVRLTGAQACQVEAGKSWLGGGQVLWPQTQSRLAKTENKEEGRKRRKQAGIKQAKEMLSGNHEGLQGSRLQNTRLDGP